MNNRNRTPSEYVYYGLYLYFSGLSLRRVSERLSCFVRRNHVSIWNWVQKYHPKKISSRKERLSEFIVDETIIKVGLRIRLAMGDYRTREQGNSRTDYIKGKKHVDCRTLSVKQCKRFMERNIQYQLMVGPGNQWLVSF